MNNSRQLQFFWFAWVLLTTVLAGWWVCPAVAADTSTDIEQTIVVDEVSADAELDAQTEGWLDSLDDSVGDGDELLLFEDIPVVVTGSRQKIDANVLPVPVSIITAEDIHYSGLTNLPEILQFASGVQVVRVDRNHYAVGVRGLHDLYSDRTLVLVDGRSAYSLTFGGAEWLRFPVLMEDIARIEIVRGPAGAAWGANAFNGVINIITKEPEDTQGFFGSTTWTQFHDSYSQFRWGAKQGKWAWRTSLGYIDQVSSEDANAQDFQNSIPFIGGLVGVGGFTANDFNRTWIIDNKLTYQLAPETKVKTGFGYSNVDAGNVELLAYLPKKPLNFETTRAFAKIVRENPDGSGGYLQWFGNFERTHRDGIVYSSAMENDLEAQVDLATSPTNKLSFGGNVRLMEIRDRDPKDPQGFRFIGAPFKEQMVGLFVIDRWQATERLILEGQMRGDWYSETHCDWSSRLTALYAVDEAKRHILRLSGARAFRTPYAAIRRGANSHVQIAPNTFLLNLNPASKTPRNEEIYSAEFGYDGTWAKGVEFKANTYFQRYNWLIDAEGRLADPGGVSLNNIDGAMAYGAECELKLKNEIGQVSAWYNYNAVRLEKGKDDQSVRSYLTSPHGAGLTGRLFLPHDITFNTNFVYADRTEIGQVTWKVDVPKSFRWDLTLAKKFGEHAELMVGVSDLLNNETEAHATNSVLFPHETPGRTFFARFQISF